MSANLLIAMEIPFADRSVLVNLVTMEMPFGKYKGCKLKYLPEPYVVWLRQSGNMPKGRLGMLLETLYEIKLNGLEFLLDEQSLCK